MKLRIVLAVLIILMVCLVVAPETARGQGSAQLTFEPLEAETAVLSDDGAGTTLITVTDEDESVLLPLSLVGFSAGASIDLARAGATDYDIDVTTDEFALVLGLNSLPVSGPVAVGLSANGQLTVGAGDPTGDRIGVGVTISDLGPNLGLDIAYDPLPEEYAGRVTPLYPGLVEENALGGSVTIAAAELTPSSRVRVVLSYQETDLEGMDEQDLRVMIFSNATGRYEPVGENDRGIGEPSMGEGDYGVDTVNNAVWAVVDHTGSFVAGVPDPTLPSIIIDDENGGPSGGGVSFCGPAAAMWLPLTVAGLALTRTRRRQTTSA